MSSSDAEMKARMIRERARAPSRPRARRSAASLPVDSIPGADAKSLCAPDSDSTDVAAGSGLTRLRAWFAAQGWTPWPFQEDTWDAFARGQSGLVHVPTGAGKTYAAYGGPLAAMLDEGTRTPGLRVIYVTPLRAVARDIETAMRAPARDLSPQILLETRTGDTSSAVRARQAERLPHVLITTPESLSLLLTRPDARERLSGVRCAIIDEWHELIASKRGTQVELALARLRRWSPGMRTWALSATVKDLDRAARHAVGTRPDAAAPVIIRGRMERPIIIETILPTRLDAFPWAGHMGLHMLPQVVAAIDPARSTLIFTNTRSQSERWFHALLAARPEWAPIAALHHGSIDRAAREQAERGLKDGSIRLVVATSSLDLGVDFAPVERVFQIGSPKGIARLVQRAGRAGHRPGASCHIVCVPTHALQLFEVDAARRALAAGEVEPRDPVPLPLDVLAQHMVTCALGGGFAPDELFDEVRESATFAELSRAEFDWTLTLVRDGGATLRAYQEFRKITLRDGLYHVPERRIAQLHRVNIGTIAADATLDLRLTSGRRLGSIEESFIAHLRPGERFIYSGRVLEFVRLSSEGALARASRGGTNLTPIWGGTRLPISAELGAAVRRSIEIAGTGAADSPELQAAAAIIAAQRRLSLVPGADEVLVEVCRTREGLHLFMYPFEGRLVHSGLAAILAMRLARRFRATFSTACNDYGFELLTGDDLPLAEAIEPGLFVAANLWEEAIDSVNMSELAKRQFREVARVAGLVFPSFPGGRKNGRHVSASAALIFEVFSEFDPENLLLHQARREVLDRQFERSRLAATLQRLARTPLRVVEITRPTPLSLPLVVERLGARLSGDTLLERIDKMRRAWDEPLESPAKRRGRTRRSR